jgi:O-antigen ligase
MKKLFLLALLFSFCLGQLGRFDIPRTNITLHFNDLFIFSTVTIWLIFRRQKAIKFIRKGTLYRPIFFVILTMSISLLVNAFHFHPLELATSALYLVRWVYFAGFFFFLKMEFANEKVILRRGFILGAVIISVTGLLQYIFVPNTVFLAQSGWDDHYFRLIGVFFDPGFTGAILAVLLAATYLSRKRITDFAPAILVYAALSLTYSRASYLMYLIIFAALSYFKKSLKILIISTVILVATIFVLPKHPGEGTKLNRDNSVFARIKNWQQSISIWTTAPIFGVGFDTYRYVQRDRGLLSLKASEQSHAGAGADSSILLILATTGIVGFTAFMFLLRSVWKESQDDLILKTILPAVLFGSFFNNLLLYAWAMELIWVLLASVEKPTEKI